MLETNIECADLAEWLETALLHVYRCTDAFDEHVIGGVGSGGISSDQTTSAIPGVYQM